MTEAQRQARMTELLEWARNADHIAANARHTVGLRVYMVQKSGEYRAEWLRLHQMGKQDK